MKGTKPTSTKVLVIDDAVETRERLCTMIKEQTSAEAVGCSADRTEAPRWFMDLRPTCVVIDVPVHDPTGFELLAALRARDAQCLFIIVTNHATEEFRRRGLDAGADHFLAKSTEFERVVDLVRAGQDKP